MEGADRNNPGKAVELQLKDALDLARQSHDHAYLQYEIALSEGGDGGTHSSVRAYRAASRDYSAALDDYADALIRFRDHMRAKMPNK